MPKVVMPDMCGKVIGQGAVQLLTPLGRGSFGTVYQALDLTATIPEVVAVKVIAKTEYVSAQYREVVYHRHVSNHDNVVTFHRLFNDSEYIYIVLEFHPGGDMWAAIRAGEYWKNDELIRLVFLQLIDALQYCHSLGIYHRDLKPNNILVSEDSSQVFISDFGLASTVKKSKSFGVGTAQFRSPECINAEGLFPNFDAEYNDIWALGVIFATVIGGRMPWQKAVLNDPDFYRHLRHAHHLRQVLPISREANFMLERIFYHSVPVGLDEIREMVLSITTFYAPDEEIRRSPRLRHISEQFDETRRRIAAIDNDEVGSSLLDAPQPNDNGWAVQSDSLAAVEEGRPRARAGTPEPRVFVHDMILGGESLRSSILNTSMRSSVLERLAVSGRPEPAAPNPLMPQTVGLPNGTSNTLITSKDDPEGHKIPLRRREWRKFSRSFRRVFGREKVQ